MPRRECLDCRRLTSNGTRCIICERAHDQARGSTTQRGYGWTQHQADRRRWVIRMDHEPVLCWRCHLPIDPHQSWDFGHDDHDRTLPALPEHLDCNRATATRRTG
jgi:hypothetical protein